ncbi:malonyl-ACP O-methyltransferase BioC [Pseudomonas matsuisoli]|uniref:Malonyl-[acyl-carrier protein] O-methyltransferase n=1 Tax=Pseudomonas matsuisoli TaxID=1515666 RepID=A0A917Q080_9PSED|nr:malonyl-ACP O-methyltransferase BioC [Pseudomonas matsuisoli]GGK04493.1 malonyl-[acyl-carrier protein] O-methyltransferase [Pseudomonas matsuisoli]
MQAEQALQPDKRRVAQSFSRAAATYDDAAAFQRDVGEQLLARLPLIETSRWLDLGCGTGHFTRVLARRFDGEGIALDLSEGMLAHAFERGGADHWIAADAERLPFADHSLDLVFSNLAVQWCDDFARVLAGVQRALRPGGVFAFSSLCIGTLQELRESWETVDGLVHVNRFRPYAAYRADCAAGAWGTCDLELRPHVLHFAEIAGLMRELKAIGAHNLNEGRPTGLGGRQRITALGEAYEAYRSSEGLPATYQVIYGVLRKGN